MKRKIYYIFGDLVSSVVTGGAAGLVSLAVVSEHWRTVPAMAAGMALGSATAVASSLVFMLFLGDFEVMLQVMFSGMLSGMLVAMLEAMSRIKITTAVSLGAGVGLLPFASVYLLDLLFKKFDVLTISPALIPTRLLSIKTHK